MKQHGYISAITFMLAVLICAGTVAAASPRNASYRITVSLDIENKQLTGNETITWKNITGKPASELCFHLYMNAFRNNYSTFIKEMGGKARLLEKNGQWGWVDITKISVSNTGDITDRLQFIQPDDNNMYDRTVAMLPLPFTVQPGQSIDINIDFTTRLPAILARTGYYKDFFMIAQWFPKLGVFEENGQWNCHQFHRHTEFYADYGMYTVNITLPDNYRVEGTGKAIAEKTEHGLRTVTMYAEDVHDFAWTAYTGFLLREEPYHNTVIRLVYEKDHESSADRTIDAVKHALDFFNEWAGPYEYSTITVLHPPTGAMRAAGMEYPQFITAGTVWKVPENIRFTEMVTIHEFGHQYWYGMVGNNEFEEAWLDEGINSYFEAKIMDTFYGSKGSLLDTRKIKIGELYSARTSYIDKTRRDRTLRNAWTFQGGGYSSFSYKKPVLMFKTLENLVGSRVMKQIFRTYFERWKFRHPHTSDFIAVVNEVTGQDYSGFFRQFLSTSLELDYCVASVSSKKVPEPEGVFDTASEQAAEQHTGLFHTKVRVFRKGEAVMPVDVLLVFEGSDSLRYVWDGKERWKTYVEVSDRKLVSAAVDPEYKIVLDANFTNNSMSINPRKNALTYFFSSFLSVYQSMLLCITGIL